MTVYFGNQPTSQHSGQYFVPTVRPQAPEILQRYLSQFKDEFVKQKVADVYGERQSYNAQQAFNAHSIANLVLAQHVQGLYDTLNILVANMQPYENPDEML